MNTDKTRRTMSLEEIIRNLTKFEKYLNNKKEEDLIIIINYILRGIALCGLVIIGGSYLLEPLLNSGSNLVEYIQSNILTIGLTSFTLVTLSSLSLGLIKINTKTKKFEKGLSTTKEQLELACQELERFINLEKESIEETIRHLESKTYKISNPDFQEEHHTPQPETIDTTIYVGLPSHAPKTLDEHRILIHKLTSKPFEEQLIIVGEQSTYKENIPNYSLYELTKEQRKAIVEKTDIFFKTEFKTNIDDLKEIPDRDYSPKRKTLKKSKAKN